ncbi:zf-HC2 domain-containing protein [Myxococcus sp. K15C18031901]|uniref:anti-sigma factor family protein n=1 Tax=Myxococcus dinghuensis TaxID=2906761 RepID=UPI0020A72843|nr:zf-HC2 domain-containing protein [Myxococcus dinghuensis]MCP3098577.1 zf-HC2 domain-containing protein [Myxococcus dinghuensis]
MKPQNLHAHEDRLLDFAYGELAAPDAQAVEAHLQGCTRCTQALADIRGVRVTMAHLSTESAPDAGLDSLLAYAQQAARRAAEGPAPAPSRWRRWLLPVMGLASVAMVGVFALRSVAPVAEAPLALRTNADLSRQVAEAVPPEARHPTSSAAPPAPAEAPMAMAMAPAPAHAEPFDGEAPKESYAKKASSTRAKAELESGRAEGWESAGSGGGLSGAVAQGPRGGAAAKSKASGQSVSDPPALGQKEKSVPRKPESVEGGALDNQVAVAEARREPLRLGGSTSREEAESSFDDLAGMEKDTDDMAPPPAAPALAAEAPRRDAAVQRPAPSAPAAAIPGQGGVETKGGRLPPTASRSRSLPLPAKKLDDDRLGGAPATPPQDADKGGRPSSMELSRQAQDARRSGNRELEVNLLRQALSVETSGTERLGLLNRLCDAEFALGRRREAQAACNQVLSEAPGSSAAQVARSRLMRQDGALEAPAAPSQPTE